MGYPYCHLPPPPPPHPPIFPNITSCSQHYFDLHYDTLYNTDVLMAATMFERIDTDRDGVLREDDWNAELHRARVRDAQREAEELAKLDEDTKGICH